MNDKLINDWISTQESFPEYDGEYYVFLDRQVRTAFFYNSDSDFQEHVWILFNTHKLFSVYSSNGYFRKVDHLNDSIIVIDKYERHRVSHWKHLSLPPNLEKE